MCRYWKTKNIELKINRIPIYASDLANKTLIVLNSCLNKNKIHCFNLEKKMVTNYLSHVPIINVEKV